MEANEYLLAYKDDDNNNNTPPSAGNSGGSGAPQEDTNKGTLTVIIKCFSNMKPIHLSNKRITKFFIALQMSSHDIFVAGNATIDDEKAIKVAIGILNDIEVIPEKHFVYDLEGESPSAWIMIYDGTKVVNSIDFYYDIVAYNGNFYY